MTDSEIIAAPFLKMNKDADGRISQCKYYADLNHQSAYLSSYIRKINLSRQLCGKTSRENNKKVRRNSVKIRRTFGATGRTRTGDLLITNRLQGDLQAFIKCEKR